VGFLIAGQPVQVRPHRVQGVEGHHGTVEIERFQQRGEMAGLVVLDSDLQVVQQVPAVFGGADKWTRVPSERRAPREVLPSTATAGNRSRASVRACSAARRAR
jgi:hypothetical protein